MCDSNLMNVLYAIEQLMEQLPGLILFDSLIFDNVIEKLSIFHVLHDQEKLLCGFDDLIQLDKIGMPDELEDMNLACDSLDICDLLDFAFL